MSLNEPTPKQQWSELVKSSRSILLLTHQNPDGDAVGSLLGLRLGLIKLGKSVTCAAAGEPSDATTFLPGVESIEQSPELQKDLLVILDETQAKIGNISLKRISENKLIVVVTPKSGLLTSANVRLEEGSYNFDLIICVDCNNLDRLGPVYQQNSTLFYEVPIVNIDHHPDNNNFGQVNIVDLTASSTSELLVSLLETISKDEEGGLITPDLATCLLTGITTDTGSFQNTNTTPKSLTVAAQLVAAGARQQEVIRHIFKTKPLSTLRLWGRALSYIKEESNYSFIWSALSKADFVAAQAGPEESSGVIDELLKTAIGMNFVLLLTERDGGVQGSFRSIDMSANVAELANLFGGGGHAVAAGFRLPDCTLKDKESEILNLIRQKLGGTKAQISEPAAQVKAEETKMSTPTPQESPIDLEEFNSFSLSQAGRRLPKP